MTILTFPTLRAPSAMDWVLAANTQSQQSPFDKSTQTVAYPGALWTASLSWVDLKVAEWRPLAGFISSLGGRAGRFFMIPPHNWRQALASAGSPTVSGAGQTGATLATAGWTAGVVAFKSGDFLSYMDSSGRSILHQVTADVTADGSGNASVPIAPPLRNSPADASAIEYTAPKGTFMLQSDDTGKFSFSGEKADLAAVTLDIVEALIAQ